MISARNTGSLVKSSFHVALTLLALLTPARARAQDTTAQRSVPQPQFAGEDEGRRIYESADGLSRVVLDARLFLDATFYHEDKNPLSSGASLRRGRVAFKSAQKNWWTELDLEFADNQIGVRDAWIGWAGLGKTVIRAGQFKEPFGLEQLTSSRYLTFMERALPDAFTPGRHLGLGVNTWGGWWQAAGGLFGQAIGDDLGGHDSGWGITRRVSAAALRRPGRVLHLGFASSYRTPDADPDNKPNRVRFRSQPEAHLDETFFLNTGRMRDIDHTTLFGAELATVLGPFSVQGEAMKVTARGIGSRANVNLAGGYIFASYFLTGESRVYQGAEGEFGRIHPRSKRGAVELAVRASTLDLDDARAGVLGGKGTNVTIAANWYVNSNVRLSSNYVFVNNNAHATDNGSVKGNDDISIAQFRLQITF